MKSVGIVGGGVGGLSCACNLAYAGFDVTIYDKQSQLGGVLNRFKANGYTFDTGPTWYLEAEVYEEFFDDLGRERSDYYGITELDPYLNVIFEDESVTVGNDNAELYEFLGDDALAFKKYLTSAKKSYDIATEHFGLGAGDDIRDYLNSGVIQVAQRPFHARSLAKRTETLFDTEVAQNIAQMPVSFLGTDPNRAPAFYDMMSHVLYSKKVYYPDGGMYSIVEAIVEILDELDVTVKTDHEVSSIRKDGVFYVDNDEHDIVVAAANYDYVEQNLLDEELRSYSDAYWESRTYSPSAFVMYIGVDHRLDGLEHQNFVFPDDIEAHYDSCYNTPKLPDDPAYYVCAPSNTDDEVAPDGKEALFVFVPISRDIDMTDEKRERFGQRIIDDLGYSIGQEIGVDYLETLTIPEFKTRFNYQRGAALGLTHTLRQTGFGRPNRQSKTTDGLYYTGSFTAPGVGVPICLKSGEETARVIIDNTVAATA